jgi:hypothetical protein
MNGHSDDSKAPTPPAAGFRMQRAARRAFEEAQAPPPSTTQIRFPHADGRSRN